MDPLILAHRGSQRINGFPENTIAAFQEAHDLGAHGIELDLRMTADHEIIVYHDSDFNRLFGIRQKISRTTLKEIRQFSFPQKFGSKKISIPLLREVFNKFGSEFYYNLEIKPSFSPYGKLIKQLIHLIDEFNLSEKIWISSFDAYFLWLWNLKAPQIPTGYLFEKVTWKTWWLFNRSFIDLLHPAIQTAEILKKCHLDKKICFWTINLSEQYEQIKSFKPMAIITDDVSIFSDLLKNKFRINFRELND
jgi:glycerophosphoryl diester phosphodiesterase